MPVKIDILFFILAISFHEMSLRRQVLMKPFNSTVDNTDQTELGCLIAVYPADVYAKYHRLLTALQDIYSVRFAACHHTDELRGFQAALFLEATGEVVAEAQQLGIRCFICPFETSKEPRCVEASVQFADSDLIDEAFRGQCFKKYATYEVASLNVQPDDVVLASKGDSPIWLRRSVGNSIMDIVAVKPRVVAVNEILREQFNRHCFSHILPLMHFVREVAGQAELKTRRQACIIIDDPSLYFESYGFVHFGKLAEHAKQHGYHAVIASIAMDTWLINPKVAAVFKDNADKLSLIIHGNNHLWQELSANRNEKQLLAITAQALRRFKRCQTNGYQFNFTPVLEAPYGTFVAEAAKPMAQLGYAAALCTPTQFIRLNRDAGYPAAFGCGFAEVLPEGLAMIPRLVMSEDWRVEVAIAAFLRQPIVLATHHQDFFEGLDLMAEFAAYINRLSNVDWCSVGEMVKANYVVTQKQSALTVKLGARNVECRIPPGASHLVVERPWLHDGEERLILNDTTGKHEFINVMAGAVSEPLPLKTVDGSVLIIDSPLPAPINPYNINPPAGSLWTVARKFLQENRDRLYPLLPKVIIRHFRDRRRKRFIQTILQSQTARK
ncbi:hypothetical protein MCAMS1_02676 [biofilm metagenome]